MINNEVGEEKKQELHIPIRLNYFGDNDTRATYENRNTWPVNSDRARLLRREFVQEGFRRLYRSAASSLVQDRIAGAVVSAVNGPSGSEGGEDEEIIATFGTVGSIFGTLIDGINMTFGAIGSLVNAFGALNDAMAADFRQTEVNGVDRDVTPQEEEWMYYAQ